MWSSVKATAARQLRVSRAVKVNTGLSVGSRVANGPASFVIPSSYRLVLSSRHFSETTGQLAEKTAAKTTAAKPRAKKTTTAAKKPAAKKATTKRATATKRKAVKAKKPAAKKAAPKKRVKKVLTPEEKRKLEIRELKKIALLSEPKRLPDTAWMVYMQQGLGGLSSVAEVSNAVKGLGESYASLSSLEKQRLETTASQNRLANQAAYKAWVEGHSPIEVDAANRARRRLRVTLKAVNKPQIKDERLPKRPVRAYSLYVKERITSGDFSGQKVTETFKVLGQDWKSLSDAEKRSFDEAAAADGARYAKEVKSVLHRDVATPRARSP